jgi:WD40 repeat protein
MRAWDITSGVATPYAGETHKNRIIGLAVSASGVVSCGLDGTLIVSPEQGTYGKKIDLGMEQEAPVAFGCGRTLCATGSSKDRVIVTRVAEGDCMSSKLAYSPTAIAVAQSDSQLAIGGSDNIVHVLGPDGGELFKLERHRDAISAVAFSIDCAKLASGCANKEIVIWSTVDGSPLITGLQGFHSAKISTLAWSPGGTLASGGIDAAILVWDAQEGKVVTKKTQAHIAGAVTALIFVEDSTLVSCGYDACVKVWKL